MNKEIIKQLQNDRSNFVIQAHDLEARLTEVRENILRAEGAILVLQQMEEQAAKQEQSEIEQAE